MIRSYPSGAKKRKIQENKKKEISTLTPITTFFSASKDTENQEDSENSDQENFVDLNHEEKVIENDDNSSSPNPNLEKDFLKTNFHDNVELKRFLHHKHAFPVDIASDSENHQFPFRLLHKILQNGEKIERDWIWWSFESSAIFCAPCLLQNKESNVFTKGWSIHKGWRNLKDKIPLHESTEKHKHSYVSWKNAIFQSANDKTVDNVLIKQLNAETEKWKEILKRVLDVILFLSERGLAFQGSSKLVYDLSNGNFLGILELIAKYDSLLYSHLQEVKLAQSSGKRMQAHYLSTDTQNEFIKICGDFVEQKIIKDVKESKYFSIICDSTPDVSHDEQLTIVLRFVKVENNNFEICERFLTFDNFSGKTGKLISERILHLVREKDLNFDNCVGCSFDNARNMSGIHQGVQAYLKKENSQFLFTPCGNHTLDLAGNDSSKCCEEAIFYFGMVQKLFNFFSCSPQRWEILEKYSTSSLGNISKTRWYAKLNAVKPILKNLDKIVGALKDVEGNLNLTPEAKVECKFLVKYFLKFETVISSTMWLKFLTLIYQTNLLIEARGTTLDVAAKNIESLTKAIKSIKWNQIYDESKENALKFSIEQIF
jgi:hypothetical protein